MILACDKRAVRGNDLLSLSQNGYGDMPRYNGIDILFIFQFFYYNPNFKIYMTIHKFI